MSKPPEVIRIKRRREDDAPVQALYIESSNSKRQRKNDHNGNSSPRVQTNYVFKLAHTVPSPSSQSTLPFSTSFNTFPSSPSPSTDPRNAFSTVLSPPTPRHAPKDLSLPAFGGEGGNGVPITRKKSISPAGLGLGLDTNSSSDAIEYNEKGEKIPLSALLQSPEGDRRMITPITPISPDLSLTLGQGTAPRDIKRAVSPAGVSKVKRRPVAIGRPRITPSTSATSIISTTNAATIDPDLISPGTKTQIRRFHFTKRVKFDSSSVSSRDSRGKKRDRGMIPVFVEGGGRVSKKRSTGRFGNTSASEVEAELEAPTEERPTRRKPRVHPLEKARLEEARSRDSSKGPGEATPDRHLRNEGKDKEDELDFGSDELTSQLQAMVLDYISSQPGLANLPPTPKPPSPRKQKRPNRLGGGLGGGTWASIDKQVAQDIAASTPPVSTPAPATTKDAEGDLLIGSKNSDGEIDDDADGEWVYDVYYREEVLETDANFSEMTENEKGVIGVLVISNSDDEQWSFGAEDEVDSDAKVWGSEDEDSNAEDFHTNDYPDEESGPDGEDDFFDSEDDEAEVGGGGHGRSSRFGKEDDYDADYDLDVDDDRDEDSDDGGGGGATRGRIWER